MEIEPTDSSTDRISFIFINTKYLSNRIEDVQGGARGNEHDEECQSKPCSQQGMCNKSKKREKHFDNALLLFFECHNYETNQNSLEKN